MKKRNISVLLVLIVMISFGQVAPPPPGWGGFQMGLVNNNRVEWDAPMKDAMAMGDQYKLNRRYIYIDDTLNVASYWTGSYNWSKLSPYAENDVRPGIVIYMLQRGGDSWSAINAGMSDKTFMEAYFRYIALIADSTKGQQPIYVLEPDVWTYMLQNAREQNNHLNNWDEIVDNNFDAFCHINDLGFPWLEEFENKMSNLPGAIIKTIKMRDPEAYAGILVGFWGFQPQETEGIGLFNNVDSVIAKGAQETGKFAQALVNSTAYKGDFCGLEKNGQDAGFWTGAYRDALFWDDRQNAAWVNFAKTISDSTDLPMVGWQISIGHEGLANVDNEYEDTFFPYFFTHTQDYIDAGVIGMLAGVAGQGKGTMATPPNGQLYIHPDNHPSGTRGDDGWFYTQYANFNTGRPWLSDTNTYHTIIAEVIPDTVVTDSTVAYPAWNPSTIYETETHGDTISHNGSYYEQIGWYINNVEPGTSPTNWEYIGPAGEVTITVGGTVDNSVVYYVAGTSAVKNFMPEPIDGYGIDTIWVNGVPVDNTGSWSVPNVQEDVLIQVKFVPGGDPVVPVSTPRVSHKKNTVLQYRQGVLQSAVGAEVTIYSAAGKRVVQKEVLPYEAVPLKSLARGVYMVQAQSVRGISSLLIRIGD